ALPVLAAGIRQFPRDIELHLLSAVCRTHEAEFDAAQASFDTAFRLMTPSERRDYQEQSTRELLEPRYDDALDGATTQEQVRMYRNFWAVADPLYLSKENEALLEHYSRIAMANLLFSHPLYGIRGWETDRGKTLLRYGMPPSRLRLRPSIEVGSRMRLSAKTELWFYPGAVFGFTDEYNSGQYSFSVPDEGDNAQYDGNARQLSEDLARVLPYRYRPSGKTRHMFVPSTLFRFRSNESTHPGDLEIAIAYAMPLVSGVDTADVTAHEFGVFLLDDYGRRLFEQRETVRAETDGVGLRKNYEGVPVILRCPTFFSAADSGNLSLEWLRDSDGAAAVRRHHVALRALDGQPALSDIVLASTVAHDAPQLPLQRGTLGISPYPRPRVAPHSRPTVYFEVYELGLDSNGNTDFDLQITMTAQEGGGSIFDALTTLLEPLGIGGRDALTTTTGYITAGPQAQLYLQLDLRAYDAGMYDLRVRIDDHVRSSSIEQSIPLEITGSE
ncbi:MAG: GWxTD domain-containing protein, partial [Bacteroidota bacterium]|nr:GWxTD domain-containing protein [Bacteroidota bacterium]